MTSSRAITFARAEAEKICDFVGRLTRYVPKDLCFDKGLQSIVVGERANAVLFG